MGNAEKERTNRPFLNKSTIQLVVFNIGRAEYGIDILKTYEIMRQQEITQVPRSPQFVEGIINLRGNVIPIIDLRKRFNIQNVENTKKTRTIVVAIKDRHFGIIVDNVNEVISISTSIIEPPMPVVSGLSADYIMGIGKMEDHLLIILDIEKILTTEEKIVLEGQNFDGNAQYNFQNNEAV